MRNRRIGQRLGRACSLLVALSLVLTLVSPAFAASSEAAFSPVLTPPAVTYPGLRPAEDSQRTAPWNHLFGLPWVPSRSAETFAFLNLPGASVDSASPNVLANPRLPAPDIVPPTAPPVPGSGARQVEVGPEGGTVDLPGEGELVVPAGALATKARISRNSVEMRLSNGLFRYHPIDQPVRIEARRADTGASLGASQPISVRLKLGRPEIPPSRLSSPAVRALKATGWETISSSYDAATKTLSVSLSELPVTLVAVDASQEVSTSVWDPKDTATIQLGDGAWGIAYIDGSTPPNLFYRRSLGTQTPTFWVNEAQIDSGSDSPSLVKLDSTLALFYRKTSSGVKQVHMRTSTDDGITWSSATQLTTEATDIYQIEASVVSGTVYLFFSLSDTSGSLQYRTSTDLSNWAAKASVGQAIGPLQGNTYPSFDIKRLSSGVWGLAWLNVSLCNTYNPPCTGNDASAANSTNYPVVWYASSSSLGSTTWSNKQELNLPYTERWPKAPSLAQSSGGTAYLSFTNYSFPWDYYQFYRTSADGGATWASKTRYGYEPTRTQDGWGGVLANDSYLVVDSNGAVRSFWDQQASGSSQYKDDYPIQLFYRDLPSGDITPIPAALDTKQRGGTKCEQCRADPVSTSTGTFTLPETDVTIPGRGLGLAFSRTYNSARLVDGPLGYGWSHNLDLRLTSFTHGEALIVAGNGRMDLYTPKTGGGYDPPPGQFGTLVHNGDGTWTLTEVNQVKYTFSSAGRLSSTAFPTGVTESRTYNNADQLTNLVSVRSGITITNFVYSLDNAGLRTSVVDPGGTESYSYDNLYRLTGVTYSNNITQTYSYDAVGNRLTKVQGGTTTGYTYNNGDRMTVAGGVNYTYDNNGNQTGRGNDTFTWDYENRLTGATVGGTTASYAYRGDGLRHSKTVGGNTTTYTWDLNRGLPVILQDSAYTFVYGLGLVSQTDGSGAQSYLLGNGLGSTEALTDAGGTVVATYKYDVFGAVRSQGGTGNTEYRFTGEQDDATLGYTYLRARYYDMATGRFISKDPFRGTVAIPASQHPYNYAYGIPTSLTDPSGKFVPVVIVVAGVVYVLGPAELAVLGAAAIAGTIYIQQHQHEIKALVNSCSLLFEEKLSGIFFAGHEKTLIDSIARERGLTKDQRRELGRAVEESKRRSGIPNYETLKKPQIEDIADDAGLDNRK